MSNQSRWMKNMIDISVSDEYKDAILEWEKGMLPPFKGVGNCLCGARMKNFHLITNKYNNNTVFAGSSCLKKIDIHITKKIGGTNALLHYNGEMPIFDILDMPKYLEQCSEIIRKLKEQDEQDEQERLRIEHQDEHPAEELLRQLHCIEEERLMKEKKINKLDNALCYVIGFGKYKNTNLFTVYVNDRSYFGWLNNNTDTGNIRKAINIMIKQEKLLNKRIKSLDRTLIKLLQ
jgi:hypothetical protein